MAGERRESDGRDGRAARALHSGLLLGYAMSHTDCTSVSVRYNALRTRFTLDTKLQLTWCLNPSCGELLPCMRLLASRNVSRRTAAPSQPQRDDSPRHEPRCRRYTMMTMMTVSVRSLPMPRSDKFNEHRGAIEGPSARTGMDCYECSAGLAVLTPRIELVATHSGAASRQRWHRLANKATASPSHRGRVVLSMADRRLHASIDADVGVGCAGRLEWGRDRIGDITRRDAARAIERRDAARRATTRRRPCPTTTHLP